MYSILLLSLIILLLLGYYKLFISQPTETFDNPNKSLLFNLPSKFSNLSKEISIDLISEAMNENTPPYLLSSISEQAIYYKGTIPIRLRDWASNQISLILNGLFKGTGQPWKFTSFEVLAVQKDTNHKTLVSIEFFAENPDEYSNRRFMIQLGYENNSWRLVRFEPLYSKRLKQILENQLGTFGIDSNFVQSPVNLLNLRFNKEIQLPGLNQSELETSPLPPSKQTLSLNTTQRELEDLYNTNPPSILQEPCRNEKFAWDTHAVQITSPTGFCSITNTGSRNWNTYPYTNPTIWSLDRTNDGLHSMFDRSNNIDASNIKAL